jgi:hypothetical protein
MKKITASIFLVLFASQITPSQDCESPQEFLQEMLQPPLILLPFEEWCKEHERRESIYYESLNKSDAESQDVGSDASEELYQK